jgi:hypothetical protein
MARSHDGFRLLRLVLARGVAPDGEAIEGLQLAPTGWRG